MNKKDKLNKIIEELKIVQDERNEKHSAWLKNILTVEVGLLSVVVSFKQTISTTHLQFFSFSLTISLLVISVIFGVISLFYEVHLLDKMRNKLLQIQESVSKDENTSKQGRVSVDKSYIVYEYVCLISSALALI